MVQSIQVRGAVASWLALATPDRAFRVGTLAGDIVLYSWAKHFTLTVSLSTQVCKRWPDGPLGSYAELQSTWVHFTSSTESSIQ